MDGPREVNGKISNVLIGEVSCCAQCGCDGLHGCMGPSEQWQQRLVREVWRLRAQLGEARREQEVAEPDDAIVAAFNANCDRPDAIAAIQSLRAQLAAEKALSTDTIAALQETLRTVTAARDTAEAELRVVLGKCHAAQDEAQARIASLEAELRAEREWDDGDDTYDAAIRAAHPTAANTPEAHDRYALAMTMIRTRRSKHSIVSLVCWLLGRVARAESDCRRLNTLLDSDTLDVDAATARAKSAEAEHAETWRLVWKLIDALPKCFQCDRPATKAHGRGDKRFCDVHGAAEAACWIGGPPPDYPRAAPTRELMARRPRT